MKIRILVILNILMYTLGYSQSFTSDQNKGIKLESYHVDGEVKLRWYIEENDLWSWANKTGYVIERTTISSNGIELDFEDRLNSTLVLESNYKPFSQAELIAKNTDDNPYLTASERLLYSEDVETKVSPNDVSLAAAVNATNLKESQHFMSMMVSELDFDAACALGMAYVDNTVVPNHEYLYSVSISQVPSLQGTVIHSSSFEEDLGIWQNGRPNNGRGNSFYPKSGVGTLTLQSGNASAFTETSNMQFLGVTQLKLDYSLLPLGISTGDGFIIEYSFDGGNTYQILKNIAHDEIRTKKRFDDSVILTSSQFSNHTKIRLKSYCDGETDYLFFDDIKIWVLNPNVDTDFVLFNENDFESDLGVWIDGGAYCYYRIDDLPTTGNRSLMLRNDGSAQTNVLDLSSYNTVYASFAAKFQDIGTGKKLIFKVSKDGGSTFQTLKEWIVGTDVTPTERLFDRVKIDESLINDINAFQFELTATENSEQVAIDDFSLVGIEAGQEFGEDKLFHENEIKNYYQDFERSTGIWQLGGANALHSTYTFASSGVKYIQIWGDSETANTETDVIDLSSFNSVKITCDIKTEGLESGDNFDVEFSNDGGLTYTTLRQYDFDQDIIDNKRFTTQDILENFSFSNNSMFRIKLNADANNDKIYLDDIEILGTTSTFDANSTVVNYSDFESGWGIWNDGGSKCLLRYDFYPTSGIACLKIRNGDASSNAYTTPLKYAKANKAVMNFDVYIHSVENGESLKLMGSNDGGVEFFDIKEWVVGENGINSSNRYSFDVEIPKFLLSDQTVLQFQGNGGDNTDNWNLDNIRIETFGPNVSSNSLTNTDANHQLPTIDLLRAKGGKNEILIAWDLKDGGSEYSSFDIERSADGGSSWVKINDFPFVYGASEESLLQEAIYTDPVTDYTIEYSYRVCGKSSYGATSGPSNIMSAQSIAPLLTETILVDDVEQIVPLSMEVWEPVYLPTNDNLLVSWKVLDSQNETQMIGYDIYRSRYAKGPYQKLNSNTLVNTTYEFTDINPLGSAYYKIVGTDQYDNVYESHGKFAQLPDEDAPDIPIILSAEFLSVDKIEVKWQEVIASDLGGYRIFFANKLDGNYTQVNEQPIKTESYSFYIDNSIAIDQIFIKLASEDLRQNISDYSDPIAVDRPDVHGPSSPLISSLAPSPNGIEIAFVYSSSDDVERHVLERRASNSPTWVEILDIPESDVDDYPTGDFTVSFTDELYEDIQEYEYRFIAYDEAFNSSVSVPHRVTPFRKQIEGNVSKVNATVVTTNKAISNKLAEQLARLKEANVKYDFINTKTLKSDYAITIDWEYTLDPQLKEFQIYRSMTGGNMTLYRTVSLPKSLGNANSTINVKQNLGNKAFQFEDKDIIPNIRYSYQVKAVRKDGTVSNRSASVSKLIEAN